MDVPSLATKLQRYRAQLQTSVSEVALATGISEGCLKALETAERPPTLDELRRLDEYYRCGASLASGESDHIDIAERIFARYDGDLSRRDRWAIVEFLFLCSNEEHLWRKLGRSPQHRFSFAPSSEIRDEDGALAAAALRKVLGYGVGAVAPDVYNDLRRLGIHVFRRQLQNSNIAGIFVQHPIAGRCVLVNFSDDVYRQRFAAAHEAAHAILDGDRDFIVSLSWDNKSPIESRADAFAAHFLVPPGLLRNVTNPTAWDPDKARHWARKLMVNVEAFAYALRQNKLVDAAGERVLRQNPSQRPPVEDTELWDVPASDLRMRVLALLRRGLSDPYVNLCFDAYDQRVLDLDRLAQTLLVTPAEVQEIGSLFGRALRPPEPLH